MRILSFFASVAPLICFAAQDDGKGGGANAKTDLEKLNDANARITALEGEKKDAEQKASDAEGRAVRAEGQVKTLQGEKATLDQEKKDASARAEKAEGEVNTLKGEAKGSEERAREIAAASGVTATPKTDAGANGRSETDGKALYEAYNKLMTDGESRAASEFWAKHEKDLTSYAESLNKKQD